MTRDELRTAIFDTLMADKKRCWNTPAVETDAIMAVIDTYSVGLVRDVTCPECRPRPTVAEALAWLKTRRPHV